MNGTAHAVARAASDADDALIWAEEPLAGLQLRCGGDLPGPIAVPALRELVTKSRRYRMRLARRITATTGEDTIAAWVEVCPAAEGEGCEIALRNWQIAAAPAEDVAEITHRRGAIDRQLAELTAQLDAEQRVLAVSGEAADLDDTIAAMRVGAGRHWTDFVGVAGDDHHQPMHWRLLDGANVSVTGSARRWRAALTPYGMAGGEPSGFELNLVADEPLMPAPSGRSGAPGPDNRMIGRELAPVLRQPIARIVANAETIRTRLAGPLADDYARYAADIAAAGQHLLGLIDDLSDLEVVEAADFSTAPDRINLAEVGRQAAGILAVRARERGIQVDAPRQGKVLLATAEFRRVLQILLNLVGNAIRYAPRDSSVWLRLEEDGGKARIVVADQGPGLGAEQQARVFDKFERLGRSDEGGSGLGLYISRRLARAMGGDLTVESTPGAGARFTLELPADEGASAPGSAQNPD